MTKRVTIHGPARTGQWTIKVWKANRIDQEESLTAEQFLDSWLTCKWTKDASDLPSRIVHDDIPSPYNVAIHLNACLNYTFDQEPFMEMYQHLQPRL